MTLILGIETSCDETAAAVVEDGRAVRSNIIATQHDLHRAYGGVVPEIASRAHLERILPVVRESVRAACVTLRDIDAIAVGNRPGLIGSLLVGVAAAKTLAWSLAKPLIGVDHVRAHLYAPALDDSLDEPRLRFPALGLVVSGGHTALYHMRSPTDIERIGSTIDDAVGEAYDKAAAMLGLPHPGGPEIDRLAQSGDERAHDFPVSRLDRDSLDFSFSGLKTSVLYTVRGQPRRDDATGAMQYEREAADLSSKERADIAASFQRAAIDAVTLKARRAIERVDAFCSAHSRDPYRMLIVGGGVSANTRLRASLASLAQEKGVALRLPPMSLCLDNAAMIAGLAHERFVRGETDDLTLAAIPTTAQ